MDKKCSKCGELKPITDYSKCSGNKSGKHTYCKSCATKNARDWYSKNKSNPEVAERLKKNWQQRAAAIQIFVENLKAKYGCCVCGEKDGCCLDFHHLLGKEDNVSELVRRKSLKRLAEEMNKCIILCANCHRKLHANRIVLDSLDTVKIAYAEVVSGVHSNNAFTTGVRKTFC